MFSYFVLYFEQQHNEYPKADHFSFASICYSWNSAIFLSLQSFWHCRDLELFAQLGMLKEDVLKSKYDQRVVDKQVVA